MLLFSSPEQRDLLPGAEESSDLQRPVGDRMADGVEWTPSLNELTAFDADEAPSPMNLRLTSVSKMLTPVSIRSVPDARALSRAAGDDVVRDVRSVWVRVPRARAATEDGPSAEFHPVILLVLSHDLHQVHVVGELVPRQSVRGLDFVQKRRRGLDVAAGLQVRED